VVWRTLDSLAPADDLSGAVSSLWSLVLLGLACGTVAFTLVEFAKRLSPLRQWFNLRAVRGDLHVLEDIYHFPFDRNEIYFGGRLEEVTAQISSLVRARTEQFGDGDDRALMTTTFELHLDSFQLRTAALWVRLLRLIAAVTASAIAGVAALATTSRPSVVIGAVLFGLTIGGPFSWTVRDLVRVIEGRARY